MVMAIVKFQTESGIEVYIDNATGEAFTTIRGYARMAGVSESTVKLRLKGGQVFGSELVELHTPGGLQGVRKISIQFIAKYLPGDNSDLAGEMIEFGATGYLYKIAGYKVKAEKVEQPSLPPSDIRVHNLVSDLKWLGIESDNPRYSQLLKDSALTILGVGKVEAVTQKYCGVVERAEQLGYSTKQINGGSQLGKFVNKRIAPSHKETRLCQGTLRPINVFEVNDSLDDAIIAWFE
jgi:hypothetical protein